ncbi:MAG: hypothetical protein RBS80_03315 [Thermoguttaceae bacterium]|jgi:hypothetical protein|nr:hypothetical protein [Thermoguttaceae bacterium]
MRAFNSSFLSLGLREQLKVMEQADVLDVDAVRELISDEAPEAHREIEEPRSTASQFTASDICPDPMRRASNTHANASTSLPLTEDCWQACCEVAKRHHLDDYALGRLAPTLRHLPRSLWQRRVRDYTERRLCELTRLPGHGNLRVRLVADVFRSMVASLGSIPGDSHLKIHVMSAPVRDVSAWIERVLGEKRIPDMAEMKHCFVERLLSQLDIDLGPETREMVERRLGLSSMRESLEEVARAFGLTKARIGQLTGRAREVFHVRWGECCYLLDNLCALLLASNAEDQFALLRTVMNEVLGLDYVTGCTTTVQELRRRLGGRTVREGRSKDDIRRWLESLRGTLPSSVGKNGSPDENAGARANREGLSGTIDRDNDIDDLVRKIQGLM